MWQNNYFFKYFLPFQKDMMLSLILETSELAEYFQWKSDGELAGFIENNREAIGEELSDVLYWTLLMAHDFGIDLSEAFHRKMSANQSKYPAEKARGKSSKYSEL